MHTDTRQGHFRHFSCTSFLRWIAFDAPRHAPGPFSPLLVHIISGWIAFDAPRTRSGPFRHFSYTSFPDGLHSMHPDTIRDHFRHFSCTSFFGWVALRWRVLHTRTPCIRRTTCVRRHSAAAAGKPWTGGRALHVQDRAGRPPAKKRARHSRTKITGAEDRGDSLVVKSLSHRQGHVRAAGRRVRGLENRTDTNSSSFCNLVRSPSSLSGSGGERQAAS